MKKTLLFALIIIFTLSSISYADVKLDEYYARSKNPLFAFAFSYIPGLGHYYAGDWYRGVPFLITDLAGIAISYAPDPKQEGFRFWNNKSTGSLIFGISWIWGMFDAYGTAVDHNEKLKIELGLIRAPLNELEKPAN